tara:strand:+ start:1154 stop:2026 length:873 start_codon:yes stop_codon:yes gene_type:complete
MNIGICGIGNMGRNHLRICKKLESTYDDFNISAIYDPNVKEYSNKEEFFNNVQNLSAVIVATPSTNHVDMCLSLLEINSSLKILVEKPIDDNINKAESLLPYQDNISVGHIERFNPAVKKLKSLIEEKVITGISVIRTKRLNHTTSRASKYVNLDLLVHDVDISNFLLDSNLENKNIIKNETNKDGVVDHAILTGCYNNFEKTALICEASWSEPEKIRTLELVCNEGKYCLDYMKQSLSYTSYAGQTEEIAIKKSEPLYEELLHFKSFVDRQVPPGCTVSDAIRALREAS